MSEEAKGVAAPKQNSFRLTDCCVVPMPAMNPVNTIGQLRVAVGVDFVSQVQRE